MTALTIDGQSATGFTLDALFATETMAELSARQGRMADAVAIYQHLVRGAEAEPQDAAKDARLQKWKARLAELQGGAPVTAAGASPANRRGAAGTDGAEARGAAPAQSSTALVIRDPVRSGQVVYADGRDLIVMAPVSSGAQLLADGNIHVYGPLKGRAVAGVRGQRDAQVFCLALEAELVGVDTGYILSDDLPPTLWGGPARIFLTPEGTCAVAALTAGKVGAPATTSRLRRLF